MRWTQHERFFRLLLKLPMDSCNDCAKVPGIGYSTVVRVHVALSCAVTMNCEEEAELWKLSLLCEQNNWSLALCRWRRDGRHGEAESKLKVVDQIVVTAPNRARRDVVTELAVVGLDVRAKHVGVGWRVKVELVGAVIVELLRGWVVVVELFWGWSQLPLLTLLSNKVDPTRFFTSWTPTIPYRLNSQLTFKSTSITSDSTRFFSSWTPTTPYCS